jgi:hypothetical protein
MVALIIAGMLTSLALFAVHDLLIASVHHHHREEWDGAGSPRGYYWLPPDGPIAGLGATRAAARSWLFRTPRWKVEGRTLRILLLTYRGLTLTLLIECLVLAFLLFPRG